MFLFFKEALHNIVRHAGASHVSIALRIDRRALRLTIADDGAGFDIAAEASGGQGQGLRSMRQRAEAIGGRVEVTSAPGRGAAIVLEAPIRQSVEGSGAFWLRRKKRIPTPALDMGRGRESFHSSQREDSRPLPGVADDQFVPITSGGNVRVAGEED